MASIPEINDIVLREHPMISLKIINKYIEEFKKFDRYSTDSMNKLAKYILERSRKNLPHDIFPFKKQDKESTKEMLNCAKMFSGTYYYPTLLRTMILENQFDIYIHDVLKIKGYNIQEISFFQQSWMPMRANIFYKLGECKLAFALQIGDCSMYRHADTGLKQFQMLLCHETNYDILDEVDLFCINELGLTLPDVQPKQGEVIIAKVVLPNAADVGENAKSTRILQKLHQIIKEES